MIMVSEVLPIKDSVTFLQDFVPLDTEVIILTQIAHIEQLLVVLLKQTKLQELYRGLM